MDVIAFRLYFFVLGCIVYLNVGTDGSIFCFVVEQAAVEFVVQVIDGCVFEHFMRCYELLDDLCVGYVSVLYVDVLEIVLMMFIIEGIGGVLVGIGVGEGDEIVIFDSEHLGVVGSLLVVKVCGAMVCVVLFKELVNVVMLTTMIVVCLYVNWFIGELALVELGELDVMLLFDGA